MGKNWTYHPRGELVDGFHPRQHPSYQTWVGVLQRCTDPAQPNYENYGGRGVTVCERWKHFKNFVEDMGIRPSKNHSIDRIDVNGNYEPSNCKWSTRKEQNRNKRVYKTNKTGFGGINERYGKFIVRVVSLTGERKQVGTFNTLEEAVSAREIAIKKEAGSSQI